MKDRSTDELLHAVRSGNSKALDLLLERYQDRIFRFGLKMCSNSEDAKDVLQETLLAMAENIDDFRGASSVSTWLYSIARNFCSKKRRKQMVFTESFESEEKDISIDLPDSSDGPDEILASQEIGNAVEKAIDSLEPLYREVILLRDVEGISATESSEILNISLPALKSRLHRARILLRKKLLPYLEEYFPYAQTHAASSAEKPDTESCPDIIMALSRHFEGEISSADCAVMEKHIESCRNCNDACESLRQTLSLCKSVADSKVPKSVQIEVRKSLQKYIDNPER